MPLYAICCVSVGALRKSPAHEAEMTSQLVFGEPLEVLATEGSVWAHVKSRYDGYEGWCQTSHFTVVDDLPAEQPLFAGAWVNEITCNGSHLQVPYGSFLTGFQDGQASWGNDALLYTGTSWDAATAPRNTASVTAVASPFLNTAYLWGGKTVFGTDCSGFTQTVYRMLGMLLPRDASQQAQGGSPVDFLQEAHCGDLAFFDDEAGRIIHVGLLLGADRIIHAAGKVRIDRIDHAGIVHTESGQHTHRLRIIKRYW
jgi:gamma-D-glutamyl-L-lysine dipeptidyl-peptidase